ncbi:hypothetical protein E2C01_026644 [Portunus trituberculatus]|uniref:Uncharacterized protein n=1 Tax=Portunus trituberculatus TaxID=210409 RepID=A0A5B7EFW3_PORTR|nr:hypothetical protein [Portunus trituberculatus]
MRGSTGGEAEDKLPIHILSHTPSIFSLPFPLAMDLQPSNTSPIALLTHQNHLNFLFFSSTKSF